MHEWIKHKERRFTTAKLIGKSDYSLGNRRKIDQQAKKLAQRKFAVQKRLICEHRRKSAR
jgi:hypothetical protein